jgi:hypothetical protein
MLGWIQATLSRGSFPHTVLQSKWSCLVVLRCLDCHVWVKPSFQNEKTTSISCL